MAATGPWLLALIGAREHPSGTGGTARRCAAVSRGRADERGPRAGVAAVAAATHSWPRSVSLSGVAPSILNATALGRGGGNRRRAGRCLAGVWHGLSPALAAQRAHAGSGRRRLHRARRRCGRGRGDRATAPKTSTPARCAVAERDQPHDRAAAAQCVAAVLRDGHRRHLRRGGRRRPGDRSGSRRPRRRAPASRPTSCSSSSSSSRRRLRRRCASPRWRQCSRSASSATAWRRRSCCFGAPDLAMTQFSVETLTVLIYVLVFRHFRNLGALSPRLVRSRDAVIAVGIGTSSAAGAVGGDDRDGAAAAGILRRVRSDAGPRAQHRQRHPGRLPGVRHDGRDHRAGDRRDRRSRAAATSPPIGRVRP